jgi:acetyl esterase/lipase
VEESDAVYAKPDGRALIARLYRPLGEPAGPLAAIVDVHGGAWIRGDRTTGALHGRALAAAGLVVISLDFRQGPDHRHPAGSADVAAGVRWTRANARGLGVDPRRIGILGSSSGGQLAILAGIAPGVRHHTGTPIVRLDGTVDAGAGDETVAFVVALYPVADPLARYRYVLSRAHEAVAPGGFDAQRLIAAHRGYFASEADMEEASVTRIVATGAAAALPPLWLAQPTQDDNVPAAITEAFVAAYRAAGGRIEHVPFPNARHGFIQQTSPDSDKCLALVRDFVARQLGG